MGFAKPDLSGFGNDSAPALLSAIDCDRSAERRRRGLDSDMPTGLVLFGGQGSAAMLEIAERLDAEGPHHLQLISSAEARKAGECVRGADEPHAEVRRRLYHAGALLHGDLGLLHRQAGAGQRQRSHGHALPVIVERNAWTLPQERYNAEWVREKQLGLVVKGRRKSPAIQQTAETWQSGAFSRQAAAIHNRAVYEIPGILRKVVEGTAGARSRRIRRTDQTARVGFRCKGARATPFSVMMAVM